MNMDEYGCILIGSSRYRTFSWRKTLSPSMAWRFWPFEVEFEEQLASQPPTAALGTAGHQPLLCQHGVCFAGTL